MTTETATEEAAAGSRGRAIPTSPAATLAAAALATAALPTAPCSVVWSRGHSYVLEPAAGRSRWVGVDDRGRPLELSGAELQRRGWSRTCVR